MLLSSTIRYCIVLSCTRINADGEDAQVSHGVVEGHAVVLGMREQELGKVEQTR